MLQKLIAIYEPHVKKTQEIISLAPTKQQPFSANLSEAWPRYWSL
jgi:hypothetical protein